MAWALVDNGVVTAIYNNPTSVTIDGKQYSKNIFSVWSEEKLNRIGIYSIANEISGTKDKFTTKQSSQIAYDSETNTVTNTETYIDKDISDIREILKEEISAVREQKLTNGALVSIANTEFIVQTRNNQDKDNINATASLSLTLIGAGQANTVIPFRDANNNTLYFTATQALDMAAQVHTRLFRHYDHSWDAKDEVDGLTVEQLKVYDYLTDWPVAP